MRYSILSKGLALDQLEIESLRAGASDLSRARLLGQISRDLDYSGMKALFRVCGPMVKTLQGYRAGRACLSGGGERQPNTAGDLLVSRIGAGPEC